MHRDRLNAHGYLRDEERMGGTGNIEDGEAGVWRVDGEQAGAIRRKPQWIGLLAFEVDEGALRHGVHQQLRGERGECEFVDHLHRSLFFVFCLIAGASSGNSRFQMTLHALRF